jgi:hypothetical protein
MIPDLALIISAYIIFRMIEVLLFAGNRYQNSGTRIAACVLAILVIVFVAGVTIDIESTGASVPTSLPTP